MSARKAVLYQQPGTTIPREDFYPGSIPPEPGVYIFRDSFGKIIYIGKATNLRKRISSYFQPSRANTADPKIRSLLKSIHSFEFVRVNNEPESLILESHLIKEYAPRYNSLMRDDKRFLIARINNADPFPTLRLARVKKNDGATYFGPFPQGAALRKTVEFLLRKLRMRVCAPRVPTQKDRKHCLARIVKDCCEPCTGKISGKEYLQRVEALLKILNGDISRTVEELSDMMLSCVKDKNFEKAAEYRDMINNITEIFGRRNRSFIYATATSPQDPSQALVSLQQVLDLPSPPRRIECYDVSNISGSLAVAAMVCFINGRPDKAKYRRFRIKGAQTQDTDTTPSDYPMGPGGNDCAMLAEALARRLRKSADTSFEHPDLIIVDGGKPQLNTAINEIKKAGHTFIPVAALAKKQEELFVPGKNSPILLDIHSPALKLLQSLRDESHRFAIAYHRNLRNSRMEESILDDIPGIGEKRKKAILNAFGSVKKLRQASPETISEKIPSIPLQIAKDICSHLR